MGKNRAKMAKNSIDNKRPLYRVFPVSSLSLSEIRQKVGGVVGVRIDLLNCVKLVRVLHISIGQSEGKAGR